MRRVLIVCYGNPLRCDDGIAWRVAKVLEGKRSDRSVEILSLHQLAPEVADNLRQCDLAIFVDAACSDDVENSQPGEIRVREVSGMEVREHRPGQFSHTCSPANVLDLARKLYNATPKAHAITVAGENFEHGESLSPAVEKALPELLGTIEQLIKAAGDKPETTKDTK